MAAEALFLTRRLSLRRLLFVAWRPGGRALSTSLGNPANYAGFPLCHSHHGRWLNLINRTFHVLRKLDVNLLRTVKLFGAAQEAGRGKAAHGQHTYCITPGDKYAVPASLPQRASLLRNRNSNRSRADLRQQPLPVDLFRYTVKVYVALRCPEGKAGGRIQGHIEVVALKIHR
jgi:hypothetical protein